MIKDLQRPKNLSLIYILAELVEFHVHHQVFPTELSVV